MSDAGLVAGDIDAFLTTQERKDLLRFLTAGSVDDGKSTLIGRLLHDTHMIYEDQLAAVRRDSERKAGASGEIDLSLLMDGLKAEREQGITIDVAYRYFSTSRRKFIIADCPGHEQYTRNMATGASNCDLAVVLIDARNGVVQQTRRHSFIVSLLGLKHVVVAVNKMDLVDYSQAAFDRIVDDYTDFATRLEIPDLRFIPISALRGDNVVDASQNTPWYRGETLLHYLEVVHIASDRNLIDLRFPVQYVNRPNRDFRGFSGTVASGVLRQGDEIVVLPSGQRTRVKAIVTADGDLQEAFPPMAVTVTLADEIDVSRGDMLVPPANLPRLDQQFESMVVWMAEEPLVPGKPYLIKHTSHIVSGEASTLRYRVDVNTLRREPAPVLAMNEVGRCTISVSRPLSFDPYARNRATGAFIVIDRLTNRTVGAGMIIDRATSLRFLQDHGEAELAVQPGLTTSVTREERAARYGQEPATIYLRGAAPAAHRIARALERRLFDSGRIVSVLEAGGGQEERRHRADLARLLYESGLICVCVLPERGTSGDALEVTLSTADASEPGPADLVLDAESLTVEACVATVVQLLKARGVIG